MITRVEGGLTYTQTFDAENRLISVAVSGQTTQFIYDGDGNLVKKIKPDGSRTIYVGGIYEVDKASGGSIQRTVTYYPVAGAMRINSTLYYTLKDHLGSASVVTDASGNILGENRYYPYGETRLTTGTIFTDKLFTGQREMAGLGIYHYGARFYSPKLGRFLSADTIVPGYANPQNLNRFSYVTNNPLRYTDPTGHLQTTDDGYFCSGCTLSPPSDGGGGGGDDDDDDDEPWEYDANINVNVHLGQTGGDYIPEYYGDYEYNTNVPYIPGISPSSLAPNLCTGPAAGLACLMSLATSFAQPGPVNTVPNFSVAFHVNYNESVGITMSDIHYANRAGQAVLSRIKINDQVLYTGNSYISTDGTYRPIPGSGGVHNGNNRLSIDIAIFTTINTPNGAGGLPGSFSITLPSLVELKNFINK